MTEGTGSPNFIELAADIVSAYVSKNSLPSTELPALINSVHGTLAKIASGQVEEAPVALTPAVPVKKSVTPDYIICLEDGKKFKSLKRHLRTTYDLTPEQYRTKWSLPAEYPMVAPNYAKARSELAKSMGLGQQRKARKSAREGSATKARAATRAAAGPLKVTSPAPQRRRKGR